MTATSNLPPIAEDPTLGRVLPSHFDAREFRRVPHNPDRYVIRLTDGRVWDRYRETFLTPQYDKRGARRVRIVRQNGGGASYIPCARIMALIVCGTIPHPKAEADHIDQNPSAPDADRWDNIQWLSPKANRAKDAKHQAGKRRTGEINGNCKLTDDQLVEFITLHDEDKREGRDIPWDLYTTNPLFYPHVSEKHLRKIASNKGISKSRAERVAEIRKQIKESLKNGT
jgi:hypothetical protein